MNLQVQQNMNNQTTLQYKWSNQVTYGHPQESHGAVAQLDDTSRGLSGNIRCPEGCLWKNNNSQKRSLAKTVKNFRSFFFRLDVSYMYILNTNLWFGSH